MVERREAYLREYHQAPKVKRRKSAYAKQWATQAKRRAYAATSRAVARGELKPASDLVCADCGEQAKQYFNEDYNLPPKLARGCFLPQEESVRVK